MVTGRTEIKIALNALAMITAPRQGHTVTRKMAGVIANKELRVIIVTYACHGTMAQSR